MCRLAEQSWEGRSGVSNGFVTKLQSESVDLA